MTVYIIATLLSCGFAYLAVRGGGRRLGWIIASALPLTIVAAARWDVGTDFMFLYHGQILSVEWFRGGGGRELANALFARCADPLAKAQEAWRCFCLEEAGYRWTVEGVVFCGGSIRAFMAVTSLLTGALVFTAVWRQCKSPVLAIYFYVATSNYFLSLNIVRQYLAIAVMLVAVEFVVKQRLWGFVASVIVATLFHRSALLLLPIWFLPRLKSARPYWGYVAIVIGLGCSFVARPLLEAVLPTLNMGIYLKYFDTCFAKDGFEWFFFAINFAFLALGTWYYDRARATSRYFVVWYWMTVLGTVALAFSGTIPLMKRINFFFAGPQFLLLPEMFAAEENPKFRKWLTVLSVLAFAAETVIAVCVLNKNQPLPYRISQ